MGYYGEPDQLRVSAQALRSLASDFAHAASALPEAIPESAWRGPASSSWSAAFPLLRSHVNRVSTALEEAAGALDSLAAQIEDLDASRSRSEQWRVAAPLDRPMVEEFFAWDMAKRGAAKILEDLANSVQLSAHLYVSEMSGQETEGMSDREKAILAADVAGLADPTPISDGTATMLSLADGDFLGAGLSFLGILPYVGDTAKGLKYGPKLGKLADRADDAADIYRASDNLIDSAAIAKIDLGSGYRRLPNSIFEQGGYTFTTDSFGRTTSVSGQLRLEPAPRSSIETQIGHLGKEGDQGGHLIGARFGGPSHPANLVPQSRTVNLSTYKKLENQWHELLDHGHRVEVTVQSHFVNSSIRPDRFSVKYSVDGGPARTVVFDQ